MGEDAITITTIAWLLLGVAVILRRRWVDASRKRARFVRDLGARRALGGPSYVPAMTCEEAMRDFGVACTCHDDGAHDRRADGSDPATPDVDASDALRESPDRPPATATARR